MGDQNTMRELWKFYKPPTNEPRIDVDDIDYFLVQKHPSYRTRCMMLQVRDGDAPITCSASNFRQTETSAAATVSRGTSKKLTAALRAAVNDQIKAFRKNNSPPDLCPVCKGSWDLNDPQEIDHIEPFSCTVAKWLEKHPNPVVTYDENTCQYVLGDKYQTSWKKFHRQCYPDSKLQWIHRSCQGWNMKKSAK